MSLRNSSTEGVFDSVSSHASHMTPSPAPHGVVVHINQPMNTCSFRQSGILDPTPELESTASFTDEMGGTLDRRRDRTKSTRPTCVTVYKTLASSSFHQS